MRRFREERGPTLGEGLTIREMIEEGVHGRLLRFGDSRQLSDAIVGLGCDPALRHAFSEKGRETVSSRFGTGRFIANIQQILLNGLRGDEFANPVAADKTLLRDN